MKLLADSTLGRLTKWLRIFGYDTAYLADADDFAVLRLARAEDRLVLTRDQALSERPSVRTLLVDSQILEEQLRQVCKSVGPPPDPSLSRCTVCNQPLISTTPDEVSSRVPPYVLKHHQRFSVCSGCNRVYWRGTHWQRMQALIGGLRDESGSDTMRAVDRDS
jgi:uncharacterized protein with PIN domain